VWYNTHPKKFTSKTAKTRRGIEPLVDEDKADGEEEEEEEEGSIRL